MRSSGRAPSAGASPSPPCWALCTAQMDLGVAAIGGKDSMSGSFDDLDVPPTLVSFAIAPARCRRGAVPRVQGSRATRCTADCPGTASGLPGRAPEAMLWSRCHDLVPAGQGAAPPGPSPAAALAEAVIKMAFGNGMGFVWPTVPWSGSLFGSALRRHRRWS